MKKLSLSIMITFLLLSIVPTLSASTTVPPTKPAPAKTESAEATALRTRLAEIKATDKSNMSASEKKQLRKEKRAVKKDLRAVSGGVYISAGALIVILLVLLILT